MTTPAGPSFLELAARLHAGDEDAAALIFEQYGRRLIGLARLRLGDQLRGKVSAESVVQSVFGTFFRMCREETLDLHNPESLWALLTRITLNKCGHRFAYWYTQRRDPGREQPLQDTGAMESWEVLAREPTPAEAAMLEETLRQVLDGLREQDRHILELSMQGCSMDEVAVQIGRSRRTVVRSLERVRLRLERLRDQVA